MNTEIIRMRDHFDSPVLADGDRGNTFRIACVEPKLTLGDEVVFDLEGIENMTDSFANACFANLFFTHRELVGVRIHFKSCSPIVRHFVLSALAMSQRMARA